MNKELKPCPFCGGEARIFKDKSGCNITYYPRCKTGSENELYREEKGICLGNQGWWGFDTEEEAIKSWNTREIKKKDICIIT